MTETGETIKAVKDNATRLGLTWQLVYGTVKDGSDPDKVTVLFDGDTSSLAAPTVSLVGPCLTGSRVAVLTVPPAGNYILAQLGSAFKLIKWGSRSTNSTASSGLQGVLRLDNIPIIAGHKYLIHTSALLMLSSVSGDVATAQITASTSGPATTASTTIARATTSDLTIASATTGPISFIYEAASGTSGMLSLLLMSGRLSGTGNISINGSSTPLQIHVYHIGTDVQDDGVAI